MRAFVENENEFARAQQAALSRPQSRRPLAPRATTPKASAIGAAEARTRAPGLQREIIDQNRSRPVAARASSS